MLAENQVHPRIQRLYKEMSEEPTSKEIHAKLELKWRFMRDLEASITSKTLYIREEQKELDELINTYQQLKIEVNHMTQDYQQAVWREEYFNSK